MGQSIPIAAYWIAMFAGVALLICGTELIRRGWFGRRVGSTPHCGKCGYVVAGIESERCPECGQALSAKTIVLGERIRRPRLVLLASFLVLLGLTCTVLSLGERIRQINWYQYKWTSSVISDLQSNDSALHDRAWTELNRRLDANQLSASQRADLNDACIKLLGNGLTQDPAVQYPIAHFVQLNQAQRDIVFDRLLAELQAPQRMPASIAQTSIDHLDSILALEKSHYQRWIEAALQAQVGPPSFSTDYLVNFLGKASAIKSGANEMSASQRDRFFNQAMSVSLRVRRDVIAGEDLPYEIKIDGRAPQEFSPYEIKTNGRAPHEGWMSSLFITSHSLDDDPAWPAGSGQSGMGLRHGTMGGSYPVDKAGKHELHVVIELSAYRGSMYEDIRSKPIWQRQVALSAPFEALPADTTRYISLEQDASMADAVRRSLEITDARYSGMFMVNVVVKKPPVDIAFDAFLRYEGKEYKLYYVYSKAGEEHNWSLSGTVFKPAAKPTKVDLIFRSSEKVAKNTIDIYKIWKGELVYPDVPLEP